MAFKWLDYYDLDELFSEEEKGTRNAVRKFMEHEIRPYIVDAFHQEKPLDVRDLARGMAGMGIIGPFIPREYGAAGTSYVTFGLICQEVGRVDSALRSFIAVESALVMYPIWMFGSEEQKRKWLPSVAKGEAIGCFGLTRARSRVRHSLHGHRGQEGRRWMDHQWNEAVDKRSVGRRCRGCLGPHR